MALSLNRLAVLVQVVDSGGFSAAARALYLSQPAVSSQIRALESSLGVQLVERLPGGARPTSAGEAVVAKARTVFALLEEIKHTAAEFQGLRAGRLTVAGTTTVGTYLLPRLVAEFSSRVPGVSCQIRVGNEETVEGWLVEGEVGLALAVGTPLDEHLTAEPVLAEQMVLVAAPDSPVVGRTLAPGELADQRFLLREAGSATRRLQEQALAEWGLSDVDRWDLWGADTLKEAARHGLGVTLLSDHATRHELAHGLLARVELDVPAPTRTISLVHRADRSFTPPERAFVALVRTVREWPA
ncbi:MAG TPA: LysR substrate-binding domain-containing protein [Pseudonocardia sp.]|nr:LysR substrate-binding domain-containing protein [Pseudonocardia sp.]